MNMIINNIFALSHLSPPSRNHMIVDFLVDLRLTKLRCHSLFLPPTTGPIHGERQPSLSYVGKSAVSKISQIAVIDLIPLLLLVNIVIVLHKRLDTVVTAVLFMETIESRFCIMDIISSGD